MTDEITPIPGPDATSAAEPPTADVPPPPPPAPPTAAPPPPPPAPPAAAPPPPPPTPGSQVGWAVPAPPPGSFGPPPGADPATASGWAPPPPAVAVPASYQWRDLRGLTNAITVFLAIEIAVSVFAIIAFANRISVVDEFLSGDFDFGIVQRANDADDLVKSAVALNALLTITLAVLVIIWTYRAMKNNEALGREFPRFKPGWGIAGWLIPFANLVIPVLILQDLWRGSSPNSPRNDTAWRSNSGSALVGWYWAALILAGARFRGGNSSDEGSGREYLDDLKTGDSIGIFGSVLAIAAAVLGILMFRRIAARQEECLRNQQQAYHLPS